VGNARGVLLGNVALFLRVLYSFITSLLLGLEEVFPCFPGLVWAGIPRVNRAG
jgi:hypothetical protein